MHVGPGHAETAFVRQAALFAERKWRGVGMIITRDIPPDVEASDQGAKAGRIYDELQRMASKRAVSAATTKQLNSTPNAAINRVMPLAGLISRTERAELRDRDRLALWLFNRVWIGSGYLEG
ncbi:hypothetical protein [Bradyrhizobium sp. 23AC]